MSTAREKQLNRERQARWRANNLDYARLVNREKNARFRARHPQRVKLNNRVQRLKKQLRELAAPELPLNLPADLCGNDTSNKVLTT